MNNGISVLRYTFCADHIRWVHPQCVPPFIKYSIFAVQVQWCSPEAANFPLFCYKDGYTGCIRLRMGDVPHLGCCESDADVERPRPGQDLGCGVRPTHVIAAEKRENLQ